MRGFSLLGDKNMVFGQFYKKEREAIFLGAPEAEAEALPGSRVSIHDVYEDYHGLFKELTHEKFIVIGRKGCGKSAFAEYTYALSKQNPNLFCSFIRDGDVNLEKIVQIGESEGKEISKENLFKWLIYTNILKLFSENEAISENGKYELLKQFLRKNSGYINIKDGEIKELIKKHGFDVNIEQFKRFFTTKINKQIEIKESRAPFYKLLPHLEETILCVMKGATEAANQNSYVIFFDDLDIHFDATCPKSVNTIIELLRVCKQVNNEVFGKGEVQAKAVILLRDDIERYISSSAADTAKIFSSYSTKINWYQDEIRLHTEEKINLKAFINKRIIEAFKKSKIKITEASPWDNLIKDDFSPKTSFKYVIDHTLLRPRDLLLLFKPLETGHYNIPLSKYDTNNLIGQYSSELAKEIKNELSGFYSNSNIHQIFIALKHINDEYDCSYKKATKYINTYCTALESSQVLNDLFERSIIGAIEPNGHTKYCFRQTVNTERPYKLQEEDIITVHNGIRVYLKSH